MKVMKVMKEIKIRWTMTNTEIALKNTDGLIFERYHVKIIKQNYTAVHSMKIQSAMAIAFAGNKQGG